MGFEEPQSQREVVVEALGPSRKENLGKNTRCLVGTPGKLYPKSKGELEIDQPS